MVVSSFDLVGAQLQVYAVSRCVVCYGDFTFFVSVCQLVLVFPEYDRKLPTPSADTNDLQLWKRRKTTICLLTPDEYDH